MNDDKLTPAQRETLEKLQRIADLYGRLSPNIYEVCYEGGLSPRTVRKICGGLTKKGFAVYVPGYWQLTPKGLKHKRDIENG